VRGLAADIRGKAENELAIELRRVAGRQIVRQQNVRRQDTAMRQTLLAEKIVDHAPADIVNVHRALAQVGIINIGECLRIAVRDLLEDVFDIQLVALKRPQHFVDQRAIFDHQQVRVEDARVLRANGFGDPLLHIDDLPARLNQRRFETGNLPGDLALLDSAHRWILVLRPVHEDSPAGDAGGNSDTLETTFLTGFFTHPPSMVTPRNPGGTSDRWGVNPGRMLCS